MSHTTVDNIIYYRDDKGRVLAVLDPARGSIGALVVKKGDGTVEIDLAKAIEESQKNRQSRAA